MRRFVWLSLSILVFAGSALAQQTPRGEVFLGGSYVRSGSANFRGWNAAVGANLNDWFGIVGDFSGHYYPLGNAHIYTYTFGPQLSYHKNAQVVPFAHALFGGATVGGAGGPSVNGFAMNLGGGIDWVARPSLAIRLIQADALVTRFSGNTSTDARLSFGVVFRFGK
jgi:hypothetical protein